MDICRREAPPWVQIGPQKAWCHAVANDHAETANITPVVSH
jgi:hypothetical protein